MSFRYTLRTPDGDDAGEVALGQAPNPGENIIIRGNREVRVLAVIPVEVVAEFVDRPIYGALEIEPLD